MTVRDAVEAAYKAFGDGTLRQFDEPGDGPIDDKRSVHAAICAFLSHPSVREPSEAMVLAVSRRPVPAHNSYRNVVAADWKAMFDELIKEIKS